MSECHVTTNGYYVVRCDACGRQSESRTHIGVEDGWAAEQEHRQQLAAAGWRWYASRTRRTYCPDCGPRQGHRMRLVEGSEPQ